jgi:hypothetical protein
VTAVVTQDKTQPTDPAATRSRFIPLRSNPTEEDGEYDGKRLILVRSGWSQFDDLVRQQNRQIEENVRMVSGQQTAVYHPLIGRWMDITDWMDADERRWRARPVLNLLLPWYIITHARATENQPICSFVPGPDRADAELAEVLDTAVKTVFFETNMEDAHDRLMGWVIIAGRGHLFSRINPHKGRFREWVGSSPPGGVPMVDHNGQPLSDDDGGQAMMPLDDGVRYDKNGQPLTSVRKNPDGGTDLIHAGAAHGTPIGGIEVDVLAPPQVRGSWGPQPWYQKNVHYIRTFQTPEEIFDLYGVEVEPTIRSGQVSDVGELERLLYGTGFFGSVEGTHDRWSAAADTTGYIEVTQRWEGPCYYPGMERTPESPGGRWTVATADRILRDGPRPAAFPYTSPLNTFEFVRIAGRPGGTSVQEALNPVQRAINDDHGRIRDHVNLSTNPKALIDANAGLKAGQFNNRPGLNYWVNKRPGVVAIEYVPPPALGEDVYKHMELMRRMFDDIGFMAGANESGQPGDSGEKVKEIRFNTDRFLGPTMRRTAGEYGRVFENWKALFPLIWDMPTTLAYAGDDNIARTVSVYPELWKEGFVNVRVDVESMLPEGRGEKQDKAMFMYLNGMFGVPGTSPALRKFWEMAHMPHLSRFAKPGGIHTTTAEQENGKLVLGAPAQSIPVYEWYDDDAHLAIHENYMASPEFLKLAPPIQDQFVLHRQAHQFNQSQKAMKAAMQMGALQNMAAPQQPLPGGAGGKPNGAAPPGGPNKPANAPSVRPALPTPPSGAIPGGVMPTAASAPSMAS